MRYFCTIITLFLTSFLASAQDKQKEAKKEPDEEFVFIKQEIEATTDLAAWRRHIARNMTVTDSTISPGCYTIVVRFIVDKYGNLSDFKIEKDPGYGLGARLIKTIRSYRGTWKPAVQCGMAVKAYKKETFTFTVNAGKDKDLR